MEQLCSSAVVQSSYGASLEANSCARRRNLQKAAEPLGHQRRLVIGEAPKITARRRSPALMPGKGGGAFNRSYLRGMTFDPASTLSR